MKEFTPQFPKDVMSKHKLLAMTALLSAREFLGDDVPGETSVVVHTNKGKGSSLVGELETLGLKVIALCFGGKCRWNENGIDLKNGNDKELSISTADSFSLEGNVVIFDEISDYINKEDSKNFNSKILIEAGNYITFDAKKALQERGIEVIPHEFFELYPLEAATPENIGHWSDRISENWGEIAQYAKAEHTSFQKAFDHFIDRQMF